MTFGTTIAAIAIAIIVVIISGFAYNATDPAFREADAVQENLQRTIDCVGRPPSQCAPMLPDDFERPIIWRFPLLNGFIALIVSLLIGRVWLFMRRLEAMRA